MTKNSKLTAMLAATTCMVLWGLSFIASKYALNAGVPPFTLAFLRYAILTPVIVLAAAARGSMQISLKNLLRLSPSALFGITAYYFCEYNGMLHTSASIAAVILAAIPIITALTESVLNQMRIRKAVWAGITASICGVALVAYAPGGEGSLFGYIMLLFTCVTWVAYIMSVRGVAADIKPLPLLAWQCVIALVTLGPLALTERASWVPLTPDVLLVAALLGLICSGACYLMYNFALLRLGSIVTSSMLNIMPIVSVAAGAALLGERLTALQFAGGAVIVAATFLVVKRTSNA